MFAANRIQYLDRSRVSELLYRGITSIRGMRESVGIPGSGTPQDAVFRLLDIASRSSGIGCGNPGGAARGRRHGADASGHRKQRDRDEASEYRLGLSTPIGCFEHVVRRQHSGNGLRIRRRSAVPKDRIPSCSSAFKTALISSTLNPAACNGTMRSVRLIETSGFAFNTRRRAITAVSVSANLLMGSMDAWGRILAVGYIIRTVMDHHDRGENHPRQDCVGRRSFSMKKSGAFHDRKPDTASVPWTSW